MFTLRSFFLDEKSLSDEESMSDLYFSHRLKPPTKVGFSRSECRCIAVELCPNDTEIID